MNKTIHNSFISSSHLPTAPHFPTDFILFEVVFAQLITAVSNTVDTVNTTAATVTYTIAAEYTTTMLEQLIAAEEERPLYVYPLSRRKWPQ